MAALDRYTQEVKCQGCGAVATLHMAEENHPYIKTSSDIGRRIESVDGDFTARMKNPTDAVVHCNACGTDTDW
jgi:hypothetical protein